MGNISKPSKCRSGFCSLGRFSQDGLDYISNKQSPNLSSANQQKSISSLRKVQAMLQVSCPLCSCPLQSAWDLGHFCTNIFSHFPYSKKGLEKNFSNLSTYTNYLGYYSSEASDTRVLCVGRGGSQIWIPITPWWRWGLVTTFQAVSGTLARKWLYMERQTSGQHYIGQNKSQGSA